MAANGEHWLDLLAARHTRGRFLKTALAGAALTLPFTGPARAGSARAASDCVKPCSWTAQKKFENRRQGCLGQGVVNGLYDWALGPAMWGVAIAKVAHGGCLELATLLNKANAWDCHQPGCSDYDLKAPDGPCEGWNGPCCPCSGCDAGYIECLSFECCSKSGVGCAYGSDCGG